MADETRELLDAVIDAWREGWDCSAHPGHEVVENAIRAAEHGREEIDARRPAEERQAEDVAADRRARALAALGGMLEADSALYERVLDTPGFTFHFNALAKLARDG